MALTWRELSTDDIAACAALSKAIDRRSGMDENRLRELITADRLDLSVSGVCVADGAELVAFGLVGAPEPHGEFRVVSLRGGVHPGCRRVGLGGELLDWLVERGSKLHGGEDVRLLAYVRDDNTDHHTLVRRRNFEPARSYARMTAKLPVPQRHVTVPSGLSMVSYVGFTAELDEATRLAFNASFADHWDSPEIDEHNWRTTFTGSAGFLPEYSAALVEESGRVASFVLGYREATGALYVGDVGTLREWRGRGLASLLLSHLLAKAAAAGFNRSHLTVDATSPTGALGVYQRCGYTVTSTSTVYLRAT